MVAARGRHASRFPDRLGDSVIAVAIAAAIATAPFGGDGLGAAWWLVALVVAIAYTGLTMTRKGPHNGQTLGKQAAGVKVMRDDGRPVSFKTAFVRDILLKYVGGNLTFGIGWIVDSLWPLGEKENRALHDLAVKTHVSRPRRRRGRRSTSSSRRSSTRSSRRRSRATSTPRAGSRPRSGPPCSRRSCRSARSHARSTR